MDIKEFEQLETLAQAGRVSAMQKLGKLYRDGKSSGGLFIPRDEKKARQLLEAAAKGRREMWRQVLNPSMFQQNIYALVRLVPSASTILHASRHILLDEILRPVGRFLFLIAAAILIVMGLALLASLPAVVTEWSRVFVACAHIVGSILAVAALWFAVLFVSGKMMERQRKAFLEETALALGVTTFDLERDEMMPAVIRLYTERFSSELLRNRLSDLGGLILTAWGWLGAALQVAISVGVIWFTLVESAENAVGAWLAPAIAVFFWLIGVAFTHLCRLLTGRYPGQSKHVRKTLSELNQNLRKERGDSI